MKKTSSEINKPGLCKEIMRNIRFKLNIDVTDTADSTPYVKETLESIAVGTIRRVANTRYTEWVECTLEERKQVGFIGNSITLENVRYTPDRRIATVTRRTYSSKHKKNYLTLEEIVDIIVRFERLDRPKGRILNDGRIERDEVIFHRMRRCCGGHIPGRPCYRVCWC
jgi:hypothetical protein